jgi:uncharacterized protein (TIRG00374 family)
VEPTESDEPDATADSGERPSRGRRRSSLVRSVASVAIGIALLVGVLPRLADLSEVWAAVRMMTWWGEVPALAAVAAFNIVTYQWVMMAALPGLRLRHAFLAGQISTAVSNTVPAGSLVGIGVTYAILSSVGHGTAAIARASVLTGWWNTLVKLAFPMVALLVLAVQGDINEGLLSAAAVGLALLLGAVGILVATTWSDRLARAAGRLAARVVDAIRRPFGKGPVGDWAEGFVRFRQQSASLLQRRWAHLTGATLLSHLSLFAVLYVSLRFLGVPASDVSGPEAFGAFSVVRLATALPITPGGLGIVEVGMSAALVVAGGAEALVVAAVLVYRVLTYLLQVVLGLVSMVVWRREDRAGASKVFRPEPT